MKDHSIKLPLEEKMPRGSTSLLRWLFYFCSPYKKIIGSFIAYRCVRYAYIGLLPVVIGFIINAFEKGLVQQNPDYYAAILFGYMIPYAAMMVSNHIFSVEAGTYEKVTRVMTLMGVRHLNALPLEWHEREGSGGKLQRVMSARKAFSEIGIIFRWIMFPIFGNLAASIFAIVTMDAPLYYIPIYMGFAATYLFTSHVMGRPVVPLFDKYYAKFEHLLSGVYEFVSSIRTVKAFHLQANIEARASMLEEEGQHAIDIVFWKLFTRWVAMNTVGCIWIVFFAGLGFYTTLNGHLSIGAFATTFLIAYNLWIAMEMFGTTQDKLYDYTAALRRYIDTMNTPVKKLDVEPIARLPDNWKVISFDKATFEYNTENGQGVHDISFTVRRGEKIAFVGESGAGKSTLVKLLMKQMLVQKGAISVDDINLKHIPSEDWLSQIGFVPQDVELFNLSIRENILIDRLDTDEEQYTHALKQAALYDFVQSLPEKNETKIGERGIKLSGGQRQRLGIARALVRQAPIIIFDEATSALDSIAEKKIQQAMENAFTGHTVFLIAHRLSTVRHVDRIIVLEEGRIAEEGSFEALIKKGGIFARLWNMQSRALQEKAA